MLSLQEAMQLDFAGGSLEDTDVAAFGFGLDASGSVDGSYGAMSPLVDAARAGEGEEEERWRRLRRKISNREAARRSRARKQRREGELERALEALRAENSALAARLDEAVRRAVAVRLDSARLHAEAGALRRRFGEAQRSALPLLGMSRPAAADNGGPCSTVLDIPVAYGS